MGTYSSRAAGTPKFQQTSDFVTASNGADITPNDNADLPNPCACINVGGAGDIRVIHAGNGFDKVYTVTAGQTLLVNASRVMATGTTATNLVAWW